MQTIALHCKTFQMFTVGGDTSPFQPTAAKHTHVKLKEKYTCLLRDSIKI
jgi:hypothetical protein